MDFNPANHVIRLCMQGLDMEAQHKPATAGELFQQAWNDASNDFEHFVAAYYLARQQDDLTNKLQWLETAVKHALLVNSDAVNTAYHYLYTNIARCYETLNDADNAGKNYELAAACKNNASDMGPFYHGTRAGLQIGDLLVAGHLSNYHADVLMNHVYFTAQISGAGLAAALAKGNGDEHVYIVEPTGVFENDPNVTDKKFPGNPTRSYRTAAPLKIVGEVTDWVRQTPEAIQQWREKLAGGKGEIIN